MNLPPGGDVGAVKQIAQIARASWRRDGFVSLHNEGYDRGVVVTKPLLFKGCKLRIWQVTSIQRLWIWFMEKCQSYSVQKHVKVVALVYGKPRAVLAHG